MRTCPNCNNACRDDDIYCENCGIKLDEQSDVKSGKGPNNNIPKWMLLIIGFIIIILTLLVVFMQNDNDGSDNGETSTSILTVSTTETATSITSDISVTETIVESTTTTNPQKNMYIPGPEFLLKEVKTGYVYCTDEEIQDYVKMRYGPNKQEFDVIKRIPNNTGVVVESEDINGWTLVYCQGNEGWCRTDFVFPDELGFDDSLLAEYNQYKS